MKHQHQYLLKVMTTGFVILMICSILLFWARKTCETVYFATLMKHDPAHVTISPSGLVPDIDNDPQTVVKSSIYLHVNDELLSCGLGIVRDTYGLTHGKTGDFCIIEMNKTKDKGQLVLYDNSLGCFVFYDVFKVKRGWGRKPVLYAGPKGVSEKPDKTLGRFAKPKNQLCIGYVHDFIVYDTSLESFFKVNFKDKTVTQGPKLADVVQIGYYYGLSKNNNVLGPMQWSPPYKNEIPGDDKSKLVSATEENTGLYSNKDIMVLDDIGHIRRLNVKTLEFSEPVYALPFAKNSIGYMKPDDLFAYSVEPFEIQNEYAGTIAAGLSRETMEIQVAVFDKEGRQIERKAAFIDLFGKPGGPLMLTTHYFLENLQPAFCGLASYFTASSFEAVDGHRGLFMLPNSFVGIFSRDSKDIIDPFFGALLILSPSILLGLGLGVLVYRNAGVMGFSKTARRNWRIGTTLFGLPAYIAYKLTKPREKLVTCVNCGRMRRPDMAKCHRCGAKWHVPELIPPMWRVIIEHEKNAAV